MTRQALPEPTFMERLVQRREDLDMEVREAAAALGIAPRTLYTWEYDPDANPPVLDVVAYARLLDRPLIARRLGGPTLPIAETLPKLPLLRKRHGLAQAAVGQRLGWFQEQVCRNERKMRDGTIRVKPLEEYLGVFGYRLAVTRIGLRAAA